MDSGRAARRLVPRRKRRIAGNVKSAATENPISTTAGRESATASPSLDSTTPVVAGISAAAGELPSMHTDGPEQVRAAAPETIFEAHYLELSSRASLPVTAAAYAGLRGFTIAAEHLVVHNAGVFPIHWAAEVKCGNVFWMHYDGTVSDMQDSAHFKGYGRRVRWQQRCGCFWSIGLPRRSTWLSNPTILSLAVLPKVHRRRGKDVVVLTNAPG